MSLAASHTREVRTLIRDVPSVEIPAGTSVVLRAGLDVVIMQSLGGSYTVWTERGMFRIDGTDADALGLEVAAVSSEGSGTLSSLEDQVKKAMATCYDPEIPVNIVELGLIYGLVVKDASVDITMTLTAPGCGMGDVLKADVERKVRAIPGVESVSVKMTFDPPWDQSRMSDAAKLELGYL